MLRVLEDGKGDGHLIFLFGGRITRNSIDRQRYGCQVNKGLEKQHGANIMALEVQTEMTLGVAREEVVKVGCPRKVESGDRSKEVLGQQLASRASGYTLRFLNTNNNQRGSQEGKNAENILGSQPELANVHIKRHWWDKTSLETSKGRKETLCRIQGDVKQRVGKALRFLLCLLLTRHRKGEGIHIVWVQNEWEGDFVKPGKTRHKVEENARNVVVEKIENVYVEQGNKGVLKEVLVWKSVGTTQENNNNNKNQKQRKV
ncbi:hypothetical protein Tco_0007273 [Tanacetum coccineum]